MTADFPVMISVDAEVTRRLATSIRRGDKLPVMPFRMPEDVANASYTVSGLTLTQLRIVYLCYAEYARTINPKLFGTHRWHDVGIQYLMAGSSEEVSEEHTYLSQESQRGRRSMIDALFAEVVFDLADLRDVLGIRRNRLIQALDGMLDAHVITSVAGPDPHPRSHPIFHRIEISGTKISVRLGRHLGNRLTTNSPRYARVSAGAMLRLESVYALSAYPMLACLAGLRSSPPTVSDMLVWTGYQHAAYVIRHNPEWHFRIPRPAKPKATNMTIFRKKILPETVYALLDDHDFNISLSPDNVRVFKGGGTNIELRRREIGIPVRYDSKAVRASNAPPNLRISRREFCVFLARTFRTITDAAGRHLMQHMNYQFYVRLKVRDRRYYAFSSDLLNELIQTYDDLASRADSEAHSEDLLYDAAATVVKFGEVRDEEFAGINVMRSVDTFSPEPEPEPEPEGNIPGFLLPDPLPAAHGAAAPSMSSAPAASQAPLAPASFAPPFDYLLSDYVEDEYPEDEYPDNGEPEYDPDDDEL